MSDVTFESPLLQHYQALLHALKINVDENGLAYSVKMGTDTHIPTIIENRRLALPTERLMSNPDWDATIALHPFSESVIRGESEMIEWIKNRMTSRLTALISKALMHFTHMAEDGDAQKKLTTDQLSIVETFGEADAKTADAMADIIEAIARGKGQMIHFYLRHSGKNGEKQAKRFAKVTFPIYKELISDSPKVFGVALRVKDRKFLKAVLHYIFDKIDVEDAYSYGSNSDVAPYYHALIHAFARVAIPLSSRIYAFRGPMKDILQSRIQTDGWLDTFDEARKGAEFIPALPFNIGVGGQGTGNDNVNAVNKVAAIVADNTAPEQRANQALNQIPTTGSNLHALINGHVPQSNNQGSGLNSVLGQLNNQVPAGNTTLSGLPRSTPNANVGTQLAQSRQFGGTAFGGNTFGSGSLSGLGGGNGNLSGLGGGTSFSQPSVGQGSPLAGFARR